MIATGKAHGKLILVGEHAVVYGQPAITIPLLNLQVQATVKSAPAAYLSSDYYQGLLAQAPQDFAGIKSLVNRLEEDLKLEPTTLALQINSALPLERGLGSSAATGAAICRAFFALAQKDLSCQTLINYTNFSEEIIHGTPSGVDAATVNSKQPLYFIKNQETSPFAMNFHGYLVIIDSGIKGKTGAAVAALRLLKKEQPEFVNPRLEELGSLAQQARKLLQTDGLLELGQVFRAAQKILRELQISNQQLDQLVQGASQAGALGTKITGGGRGGCLVALASDFDQAQKIGQAVLRQGAAQVFFQDLKIYS
ncbi:mevalonate kinase [Lactobacillus sp. DCY120]|uniref:Mevalonate kinase n=1 Tax=Bombilactobacillus apium TaxID=2675299 RepID=A0A850QYQ6_9LACO|nr:mevalonate kinase [Bombilactobacillus apium]NVY95823.1 mevalonate kinase [Bombilactobacillus apium]